MKKQYTKKIVLLLWSLVFAFTAITSGLYANRIQVSAETAALSYQVHMQDYNWRDPVYNNQIAGVTGESKRMEAIKINLQDSRRNSLVKYRVHVADIGWQSWKSSGQEAGTTHQSKAIEALQIRLCGSIANKYNIYYRVHVAHKGWLGWAKNGETAGSTGLGLRTEAIQIWLLSKGRRPPNAGKATFEKPVFSYQVHTAYLDWMKAVGENSIAGTTGRGYRLEAIKINLKDYNGKSGVKYRAHLSDVGWQGWKSSGQVAGTTHQSRAMEAVQIQLESSLSKYFDIYYRMHVKNLGWLGWAKNGEIAGTTGGGVQAEAIQIQLIIKDNPRPSDDTGKAAYVKLTNNNSQTNTSTSASKMEAFINDSRWSNGTSWGYNQRPKLSSWDSKGCCAYANDFAKYVFNKNSAREGTGFTNPSEIRAGDVIHAVVYNGRGWPYSEHWFVVLSRNGSQLRTAEGNYGSGVVKVSNTDYTVSGNTLMHFGGASSAFYTSYHYQ